MNKFCALAALALLLAAPLPGSAAAPINVVAAENFYGDVAQQIGGPDVKVTSILSNPDQDPHLFEASPSVARSLSAARVVIYNGIDYDPWMEKLLGAARSQVRTEIVVADLAGRKAGDNPHIWYDPTTMLKLAQTLTDDLDKTDPAHQADYQQRLSRFQRSMQLVQAKIAALHSRLQGTPATATEPVFGYMFAGLLGLDRCTTMKFQTAVMNNTEPSAGRCRRLRATISRTHKVKVMLYNSPGFGRSGRESGWSEDRPRIAHLPVVGVKRDGTGRARLTRSG